MSYLDNVLVGESPARRAISSTWNHMYQDVCRCIRGVNFTGMDYSYRCCYQDVAPLGSTLPKCVIFWQEFEGVWRKVCAGLIFEGSRCYVILG